MLSAKQEYPMQPSKPTKTVNLDLSVWYDEGDGHIHVATRNGEGFISTINDDSIRMRGHPHLFDKLARHLREAGVLHPVIKE